MLANGVLVSTGGEAYAGKLSLGDLPAGMYTLTVSARSSSGTQASNQIALTVDGGPVITVVSPIADHGYNSHVAVDLTVDPRRLPAGQRPTATIAGKPIPLTPPDATTPGYRATVVFGPTANPPPGAVLLPDVAGKQLFQVQATNSIGVTDQVRVVFVIDKSGPTITATPPVTGDVVGGLLDITATVTATPACWTPRWSPSSPTRRRPSSSCRWPPRAAALSGVSSNVELDPLPGAASRTFVVFPNISFRAVDLVGNQSVLSYGFSIDNIAPVADLDPPLMRQLTLSATGYQCSFAFDPLSVNQEIGDMPNDGCMVPQVFDLRARIEDDGNRASELKVTPISLVDPANTNVFIMPASLNQPLVVDSDGDGRCDQVNPLLTPLSPTAPPTAGSGVLQVRLAGVPPAGKADFEPDPTLPASSRCAKGTATAPAQRLCNSFEQPTIAIGYSDGQPAIWSVEPIDKTFHCFGNQLDTFANKIPEGWACIAVQTRDKAGNQSVSVPMRVYVKYDATGGFCPTPPASARARRRPARGPTILSRSAPRKSAPAPRARSRSSSSTTASPATADRPRALSLPDMREARVVVEGLVKRFGQKAAVDGLSFAVAPGERSTASWARTARARPPRSGCWRGCWRRPPGAPWWRGLRRVRQARWPCGGTSAF